MAERVKLKSAGGSYFAAPKPNIDFISSGCQLLDLALGGGWAERRVANVVGDKSTGKTLLMIEACANFINKYPKGLVRYRESESAFDTPYAGALGMPLDRVDFGNKPLETVEDLFEDLQALAAKPKAYPQLYIVDSLDALSDRAEMERDIDEGSYGASKAKVLSQMFRRVIGPLERANITLLVVSQVRDKIGISFGRKTTRSGGKALDFYASHVVYLSQIKRLQKTIRKVERPIGVRIKAMVDKNKIGLPFRQAEFNIMFGYGVDDVEASARWLHEIGRLGDAELTVEALKDIEALNRGQCKNVRVAARRAWFEVEKSFLPKRRKYERGNGDAR